MSRHVHDVLIGPSLQDLASELYAVTAMHDDIYDQEVHLALGKPKHVESLGASVRLEHSITFLGENAVRQPPG
jgi:hypothetical protein